MAFVKHIYNSRNYYRLLNYLGIKDFLVSTTVEITIGYLTLSSRFGLTLSTTVEITIGYLTVYQEWIIISNLQQ